MGWIALAVIGAATLAALLMLRVDRRLWSMVGSALMLGAAGYALQGRPTLAASPADPALSMSTVDPQMIDLRNRMMGRFSGDGAYLVAADSMMRIGDQRSAVRVILGGIAKIPNSLLLWTGLGSALSIHDGNQVSPTALFAFQQASRISPAHPAPPFFLGQAYVDAGQFGEARRYWARALALSPEAASYRDDIRQRLIVLDRFLAIQAEKQRRGAGQ